jgi:hypothetical protein
MTLKGCRAISVEKLLALQMAVFTLLLLDRYGRLALDVLL